MLLPVLLPVLSATIPFWAPPTPAAAGRAAATQLKVQGTKNFLVIPMQYADVDSTYSTEVLKKAFVGTQPGIQSAQRYYREVSGGKLEVDFDFLPWGRSTRKQADCGTSSSVQSDCFDTLLVEAVQRAISTGMDLSKYDHDGDGLLDGVTVIGSGKGYVFAGYDSPTNLRPQVYYPSYPVRINDKISVRQSAMHAEVTDSGPVTPRVLVHEMGHVFGLPDLYTELSTPQVNFGAWDQMDAGSIRLQYQSSASWVPTGFSAVSRWLLGWSTPLEINAPGEVRLKPGQIARLWTDPYQLREFLFLENRDRSGLDSILPGPGMLVERVRTSAFAKSKVPIIGANSDTGNLAVELLDGSGSQRFKRPILGVYAIAADLFRTTKDTLGDGGANSLTLRDGTPSGARIRNVRLEGDDVLFEATPAPKRGYSLSTTEDTLELYDRLDATGKLFVNVLHVPQSGHVVAIQRTLFKLSSRSCTGIWLSFAGMTEQPPEQQVCDSSLDGNLIQDVWHALPTPIAVTAGQSIYLGTTMKGSFDIPTVFTAHPDQDSSSILISEGQPYWYPYLTRIRAIVETAPAPSTGVSIPARSGELALWRTAGGIGLRGASPGSVLEAQVLGIQGKRLWKGFFAAGADGSALLSLPSLPGMNLLEVKGPGGQARLWLPRL